MRMETQNHILFERTMQEIYTLFDNTFQEGGGINLLNINIIQSEHGIIIDHTNHIVKNTIK